MRAGMREPPDRGAGSGADRGRQVVSRSCRTLALEVVTISERESFTLFDAEIDGTKVFVEVYVSPESGDLVMAGQDIGVAPRRVFDRGDYEYFLSVPASQKDQLLLRLMQHVFAGEPSTRTAIAEWLAARGIPHSLHSF